MPGTGSSRRATLRAQQAREAQRRRTNRIIIVAAVVVAAVVLGIVGYVVIRDITGSGEAVTPPNATPDNGILVASETAPAADALKVVIVEDFQCSACYGTNTYYSQLLHQLAADGSITLEYRQVAFQGEMSALAAQGAAAADVVGYYTEYSDAVFSHAADGYTKELLRDTVPAEIGMSGDDLAQFHQLFDEGALTDFVEEATSAAIAASTPHTPYVTVNGAEAPLLVEGDSGVVPATALTAEDLLSYLQSKAG